MALCPKIRNEATPRWFFLLSMSVVMGLAFLIQNRDSQGISSTSANNKGYPILTLESIARTAWPERTLLLLRHAKSSRENPNLTDYERPLTPGGIKAARRLGQFLSNNNVEQPEMIFSSPSVRTRETLALLQESWAREVPVVFNHCLYDFSLLSYLEFVQSLDPAYERILVVGHNPAMYKLVQDLVEDNNLEKLPPGSLLEMRWKNLSKWSQLGSSLRGRIVRFVPPSRTTKKHSQF